MTKKIPSEILWEYFSIILLGYIIFPLCIYETRYLEIFINMQEDEQLLLPKFQSHKMKPFSGTYPTQEAHQERETMHA